MGSLSASTLLGHASHVNVQVKSLPPMYETLAPGEESGGVTSLSSNFGTPSIFDATSGGSAFAFGGGERQ